MSEHTGQERDPVEMLAEEFLQRRRRGEVPSLCEYVNRYPHLADEIREVFPALVMMDAIDPQSAELHTSLGNRALLRGRPALHCLGDFRILREIGQGGMGIVYEAVQESLGRHVALKVLPQAVSGREHFRERFQREARAAARLHHTNIVPIFGVGEDQGVLYYAMQFIPGQALDTVLEDIKRMRGQAATADPSEQPTLASPGSEAARSLLTGHFETPDASAGEQGLSAPAPAAPAPDTGSELGNQPESRYYRSIAWLGVQAAEGLAHAHAQGILHRDIKPSNLLLDAHGTIWITDFGLAKTEGGEALTHSGELLGTLRYMAPERFEGKADARSDVYALGVTLYEMAALRPPFIGHNRAGLIGQIIIDAPPPLRQLAPLAPRDLETIISKAIARDPGARYATARDLADDLRCFLENRPIKARRSSASERLRRWCRRNPVIAGLSSLIAVLLLMLAVGSSIAVVWLSNLNRQALDNLADARRAEDEKTEKLWQSYVSEARAWRFSRRRGQRFKALEALAEAVRIARERNMAPERLRQLRNEAIACLALPDLRVVQEWDGWPDGSVAVDFDPTLTRYARTDRRGVCFIHRVADGGEVARLPGLDGPDARPTWSPDGRFVVVVYPPRGRARLWRLDGPEPQRVVVPLLGLLDHFTVWTTGAFCPHEQLLVVGSQEGVLWLFELPSGRLRRCLKVGRIPRTLVFNPRYRQFAVASDARLVQIVDLDSGKILVEHKQPIWDMAWHPDGRTLALGGWDNKIRLWDVPTDKVGWVLQGHQTGGLQLAFGPSGDLLASRDWGPTLRLWDVLTGQQVFQTEAPGGCLGFPAKDRRLAVWNGPRMALSEVADVRAYRTLVRSPALSKAIYREPAVSPDGRLLAVGMSDGVGLWDLRSGNQRAFFQPPDVPHLLFEPSGALLANSTAGLLRWPIQEDPTLADGLRIGPAERLPLRGNSLGIARSRDGKVLASAQYDGALVWHCGASPRILRVRPHRDTRSVAVSPDGRWVATGSHSAGGCKIWDAQSGRLVCELLPGIGPMGVGFSPDGRWLVTGYWMPSSDERGRLWEVGSWREALRLGGIHPFFSPDGKLVIDSPSQGVLRLLNPETGEEYGRLEDPNQDGVWERGAFSPDGSQVVTTNNETGSIHVWDLRAIRRALAALGLDWDAPPYPETEAPRSAESVRVVSGQSGATPRPAAAGDPLPARLAVCSLQIALIPLHPEPYLQRGQVFALRRQDHEAVADFTAALFRLPADPQRQASVLSQRGQCYGRLRRDADARADRELACQLDPGNASLINGLAWFLVTGPAERHDPHRALELAQRAVALAPDHWGYHNTLGVAHYRLGEYAQAIVALERCLRERKGQWAAMDLYVLALCYQALGDPAQARSRLQRADDWMQQHLAAQSPEVQAELQAFRAEASAGLSRLPAR
jgi:serine/threonine protein kinase/WD40 repeat protein/Flp pilus assembly protein TadD